MQLSKNFSLREMVFSYEATRRGIDNTPSNLVIQNLKLLATEVLQPIRDALGLVIVNSGYRSPILNKAVRGSPSSDHLYGLAADIEVPGLSNYQLALWCKNNLQFKQLILEFYTPGDPSSGWVHISRGNKQQVLTVVKEKGEIVYKVGLVP